MTISATLPETPGPTHSARRPSARLFNPYPCAVFSSSLLLPPLLLISSFVKSWNAERKVVALSFLDQGKNIEFESGMLKERWSLFLPAQ
ncbi:hypothetical protein E2C01_028331 [Portunus trituberculatus]|uniref:Uncharacterized protein n=1 Tax=Portunus trituberculatus TaxID=210409 RepID=A0A5B7ENR6_PORTR|nr:hypothetical protein [Portunus trituberculatus]